MITFKNVTVAGSGVLGYQIAFQTAFYGFNVIVYDINDEVLEKAKAKFDILAESYKKDLKATEEQLAATKANLQYNSNLAEAVQDADLLIEAVPENPQIKIGFYEQLAKVAPAKTVFATNSANEIWKHNTGEVMKHPGTSDETFNSVLEFAKQIGMVALPIYKEQPGYIVNSLLVPLLSAALDLYVNEVADVETIDKTWMVATGAPVGPFGILDVVGVTTAYNINKMAADKTQNPTKIKAAAMLKENYIDKNKLGVATGEGFYKYPNPAYWEKNFLK